MLSDFVSIEMFISWNWDINSDWLCKEKAYDIEKGTILAALNSVTMRFLSENQRYSDFINCIILSDRLIDWHALFFFFPVGESYQFLM